MCLKKSALASLGSLMVLCLFMFALACPALAAKDRIVLAVGG